NITISNTAGTVTQSANITTATNITIDPSATLDASVSNFSLTATANWTNNGTFVPRSGTVNFSGTTPEAIGGNATTTFSALTMGNTTATISVNKNINAASLTFN